MAALQDLDSLLGDLEETCARQPSLSHTQAPRVENGHHKMSVNKGPNSSHVNELDSLLDDLAKNRQAPERYLAIFKLIGPTVQQSRPSGFARQK